MHMVSDAGCLPSETDLLGEAGRLSISFHVLEAVLRSGARFSGRSAAAPSAAPSARRLPSSPLSRLPGLCKENMHHNYHPSTQGSSSSVQVPLCSCGPRGGHDYGITDSLQLSVMAARDFELLVQVFSREWSKLAGSLRHSTHATPRGSDWTQCTKRAHQAPTRTPAQASPRPPRWRPPP